MVLTSLWISKPVYGEFKREAARQGTTAAVLLRGFMRRFVEKRKKARRKNRRTRQGINPEFVKI